METPDKSDVHGIEVREGLMLVFHPADIPAAAAIASVRSHVGFEYEMIAVETDRESIRAIEEAMNRHGHEPEDLVEPAAGRN